LFSRIDYRLLARLSKVALVFSMALLIAVQLVGVASGGAMRWLRVGSFGFQPSDLAKLSLILYVGVMLARKQAYIKSFDRTFVPIFVWVLITCVLIGMEDLSTAAMLVVTGCGSWFVGRISRDV